MYLSRYFTLLVFLGFNLSPLGICVCPLFAQGSSPSGFRIMEYNVENLFDCRHDSLKHDYDFTPEGDYHWTYGKYWRKLNNVARGIILANTVRGGSSGGGGSMVGGEETFLPPDIIGLCEVENDSTLIGLTRRSLLRGAGYEYLMTNSPDRRGIDVALLYQPVTFRPLHSASLRVDTLPGMRPTRDILYVKGETLRGVLHVFVVHAPSRSGGESVTRPCRMATVTRLMHSVDSINRQEQDARIIVMGDFNDYSSDGSIKYICSHGMNEVVLQCDNKSVEGTYRYAGVWDSLDHVFVSPALSSSVSSARIACHPDLLEPDERYGGVKPRRAFRGPIFLNGFSDHLPIVAVINQ